MIQIACYNYPFGSSTVLSYYNISHSVADVLLFYHFLHLVVVCHKTEVN